MSGGVLGGVRPAGVTASVACALAMAFAFPVQAQIAVPAAPSRDELRGITAPETAPAAPRLDIQGGIERSPCPLADPRYADIKVTIGAVTFNNLKGATAEELEPAWKPLAGTPQPISALCDIRDAAGTILRNKGYLAAVQVPVQRIENGQVRLEVLYARVTAIHARGETRGAQRKLQDYLQHLGKDEIFDRNRAERYLLLARDLPGYNVQLTLRPAGTAPGDLIGEVTVLREPYAVDLTIQDLASRATGRWGGQIRAQVFGLTGLGDATTLSYYATADFKEQHILQASHEFRPGGDGLVVGAQFTYAWTKPDIGSTGAAGALEARTAFGSLYARYPLIRSQRRNLWASGGFDLVNQNVTFIAPLTRDRLRVLWARLDADAIDMRRANPQWRLSASVEARQGVDVLDANRACVGAACADVVSTSRLSGSPTATVLRGEAEFERAFGRIAFALRPRAQVGFAPVESFEEFSAGNYTIGRGYDPGEISGDSGIGVSGELRGPRLRIRAGLHVQPYAFVDAAWIWNRARKVMLDGRPDHDRLVSTGGGVRADLSDRFRLDAALAVPLERAGLLGQKPDPRFLVTLTTRLLPWRAL